jgi:uncharacterized MAPEG superfamily protein
MRTSLVIVAVFFAVVVVVVLAGDEENDKNVDAIVFGQLICSLLFCYYYF